MADEVAMKLDSAEQRRWLLQHIPHRICASLTWLPMTGKWIMPSHPEWKNKKQNEFHIWCICRSVDEGRKGAMRWLIEFIGVAKNKKGLPDRPNRMSNDIWIEQIKFGKLFDLADSNASKLADIWRGCSQASMHATTNTAHPPVDPPELAEALFIILEFLEKNLYLPNGFDLFEVLQDQEHRRKFPLQ